MSCSEVRGIGGKQSFAACRHAVISLAASGGGETDSSVGCENSKEGRTLGQGG